MYKQIEELIANIAAAWDLPLQYTSSSENNKKVEELIEAYKEDEWRPISELKTEDDVLLGKWFDGDDGYGNTERSWLWITSGSLYEGKYYSDMLDGELLFDNVAQGHKPTHFKRINPITKEPQ